MKILIIYATRGVRDHAMSSARMGDRATFVASRHMIADGFGDTEVRTVTLDGDPRWYERLQGQSFDLVLLDDSVHEALFNKPQLRDSLAEALACLESRMERKGGRRA